MSLSLFIFSPSSYIYIYIYLCVGVVGCRVCTRMRLNPTYVYVYVNWTGIRVYHINEEETLEHTSQRRKKCINIGQYVFKSY